MRFPSRCLLSVALLFTSSAPLHADGLLLRAPEVGEYIVYDVVLVPVQEDEQEAVSEMHGTFRVACVGIEQTDDATSRWIEIKVDVAGGGNPELHGVFKLLGGIVNCCVLS